MATARSLLAKKYKTLCPYPDPSFTGLMREAPFSKAC